MVNEKLPSAESKKDNQALLLMWLRAEAVTLNYAVSGGLIIGGYVQTIQIDVIFLFLLTKRQRTQKKLDCTLFCPIFYWNY
jgi:accessory gene regulator protein AgrB